MSPYTTHAEYPCAPPNDRTMYIRHNCNCGGAVSGALVRVFGGGTGRVDGCPDCAFRTGVVSKRVVVGPTV